MIAVQGPNARTKVWNVIPDSQAISENLKPFQSVMLGDYFIARTGYTGEDGFEITLPAGQAADFWQNCMQRVLLRPDWVHVIPCAWKQV